MSPESRDMEIVAAGEPQLPTCERRWRSQVTASNTKVPNLRLRSYLEERKPSVGRGFNEGMERSQRHGAQSTR